MKKGSLNNKRKQPKKRSKSNKAKLDKDPAWTTPKHLDVADHEQLQRFNGLYEAKEYKKAVNYSSGFSASLMEEIPRAVWETINAATGNKGLVKAKPSTVAVDSNPPASQQLAMNLAYMYVLKGTTLKLEPLPSDHESMKKVARNFQSEKEFQDIVLKNCISIFGLSTILFDARKKNDIEFYGGFIPDGILFDFHFKKLYLITTAMTKQSFALLFMKITTLFFFMKNKDGQTLLYEKMMTIINKNVGLKSQFITKSNGTPIPDVLMEMVKNKPSLLLMMDGEKPELAGIMETYTDTWGAMVKIMVVKKFLVNQKLICDFQPDYIAISQPKKSKSGKNEKPKVIRENEEAHLSGTSTEIREVFEKIKSELLKADKEIRFAVTNYYISLHKSKKIAVFQMNRKKLSIVIMHPEKIIRAQITHHVVKTLAESVKKFWNGKEDCATVVIESNKHLGEIINLLKRILKEV